ncbi:PIG-L family deacetylase [Allobranchiibius sp. GilTou38]|uniref:PIG-L family deacetylase n=1 Tax=Allobranchiibius sp. GilTou38 TaxID=2815210 RepID=UPI001AA19559|nr:PIG-L family deacetylase [Allobranchiibius sp. GilTou38]MBO1767943.1 PIG-L family deacetylase [Allobranchiibius sp. GilTou38]
MARLLFVHAHPDDETLANGIAIAHHVREGHEVHVLTATLGEEGEVIPADLAHLELPAGQPRPDDVADPLADVRRGELACAMKTLGVTSSWFLPGDWRDSGMAGSPASRHPRAFAAAPVEIVGAAVAGVVRELAPDVVVTYDEHGGYAHPDHIQVHRAVVSGVASLAAGERPRLFATLTPRSWAQEDRQMCLESYIEGCTTLGLGDPFPPSVVPDAQVTHEVVDQSCIETQAEALRCHRTQVTVHDGHYYALSNDIVAVLSGREGFAEIDAATSGLIAAQATSRQGLPV